MTENESVSLFLFKHVSAVNGGSALVFCWVLMSVCVCYPCFECETGERVCETSPVKRHRSFGAMQAGRGGARGGIRGGRFRVGGVVLWLCFSNPTPTRLRNTNHIHMHLDTQDHSLLTYTSQPQVKEDAVTMGTVHGSVACSMKARNSEQQWCIAVTGRKPHGRIHTYKTIIHGWYFVSIY